ncbi:hypothetical protein LMH87_000951 [Akanthomyces muscarius]|uniref:Uncharacterized protein n=1 Tax=Akanthomyces muscarius TaxID=2231603 RepID=A0A9W8QHV6_AKAMU|nr:hypothetical protein LMH87_000951 [Akanthomyces muscarius]KAJ4155717.1 hypothetical protein LMH87_000951 [Akanthomyces muscarius]
MLAMISRLGMLGLVVLALGLEVTGAVLLCYGQRILQQTKSTVTIIAGLGVQTFSLVLMFGMKESPRIASC